MRKLSVVLAVAVAAAAVAPAGAQTNDPEFGKQYGLPQIQAPAGWSVTQGNGQIIAVVDSGVDVDHPDLKAKIHTASRDFADNDGAKSNPDDDSRLKDGEGKVVHGHGTHVAGIAAAVTNNGTGVAGTAPAAMILALKVFPSESGGTLSTGITNVPAAIRYAVDNGAKAINLSVGTFNTGVDFVGLIETPCLEAFNRGALCVVAAGNAGSRASGYKRSFPGLIVTANDRNRNHAPFGQNADTQWALSAPGVEIYSTYPLDHEQKPGGYTYNQGTSMAAPFVAGAAALLFAQGKTNRQVIDTLLSTADSMGNPGVNGAGIVNVGRALGAKLQGGAAGGGAAPGTGGRSGGGSSSGGSSGRTGSGPSGIDGGDGGGDGEQGGNLPGLGGEDDDFADFATDPQLEGDTQEASNTREESDFSSTTALGGFAALLLLGIGWPAVSAFIRRRAV